MDSIESYLRDCVKIEPMALEEEFVRVPSDIAYWNDRYSTLYRVWLEAKLNREVLYGKLYNEQFNTLTLNGKGRVTVAEVESGVSQDPMYQQARHDEIAAECEKVRLAGVMEALRAKRDMLISIGAHQRAEMQHEPMIRRDAALAREVQTGGGFGR